VADGSDVEVSGVEGLAWDGRLSGDRHGVVLLRSKWSVVVVWTRGLGAYQWTVIDVPGW